MRILKELLLLAKSILTNTGSSPSKQVHKKYRSKVVKKKKEKLVVTLYCCCSVTQSRLTLCDPMDYSTRVFPVIHPLSELAQIHVHGVVMPSNHLILYHPLLLLPSIFPSIRVFSNESVLRIRWPKYWSFNFSSSPSNEYSGLISFRMDWLDLLAVQGLLKSFFQHHSSKAPILRCSSYLSVSIIA